MADPRKKEPRKVKQTDTGLDTGLADAGLEDDPIIAELRRLYDGVIDEPLPDKLIELLRKLDEVERNR